MIPELACYYGVEDWLGSDKLIDWTKSLLLFFDGIATNYSSDTFDRLINSDPVLAQPLVEHGLLHNYVPRQLSRAELLDRDRDAKYDGAAIAEAIVELLTDYLPRKFSEMSRDDIFQVFDKAARATILRGTITSAAIQPITSNATVARLATEHFQVAHASRSDVIVADMKAIGVNFGRITLDEVLDFRRLHGSEYRTYARDLRDFTLNLSLMSAEERVLAIEDRATELDDRAEDLRRIARSAFKKSARVLACGLAGAAWTLSKGDPVGALITTGAAAASFNVSHPMPVGASYSYIFAARDEFTR
jgi:hypothetical protein